MSKYEWLMYGWLAQGLLGVIVLDYLLCTDGIQGNTLSARILELSSKPAGKAIACAVMYLMGHLFLPRQGDSGMIIGLIGMAVAAAAVWANFRFGGLQIGLPVVLMLGVCAGSLCWPNNGAMGE